MPEAPIVMKWSYMEGVSRLSRANAVGGNYISRFPGFVGNTSQKVCTLSIFATKPHGLDMRKVRRPKEPPHFFLIYIRKKHTMEDMKHLVSNEDKKYLKRNRTKVLPLVVDTCWGCGHEF